MKAVQEIYEFITGGSIAAPIGLALTVAAVLFPILPPSWRPPLFACGILITLVSASFERPS